MPSHHLHHHQGHGGPPPDGHRHPNRLVDKLRTLNNILHYPDVGVLADAAERIKPGGAEAATYLREECGGAGVGFAIATLETKLWEASQARHQKLIDHGSQGGSSVVLVAPLPPHIFRDLMRVAGGLTVVALDGHELPPGHSYLAPCRDPIEARRAVRVADVIVFDAYAGEDAILGRHHLADLLDPAILKPEVQLGVHYRPHRKPDDVPLDPGLSALFTEL